MDKELEKFSEVEIEEFPSFDIEETDTEFKLSDLDEFDEDMDFGFLDDFNEINNEGYTDDVERIMKLKDDLAEEIILKNIEEQIAEDPDPKVTRINYLSLFREKYQFESNQIFKDDESRAEGFNILMNVINVTKKGLEERFHVEFGTDPEFVDLYEYFKKFEALYEFLFVRNYQNLFDYFFAKIKKLPANIYEKYEALLSKEPHENDIFAQQMKKKFKDIKDVVILHFLTEIIEDLRTEADSAFSLFNSIVNLDLYEETNFIISEMLINLGNDIVLNNDKKSAEDYMRILDNQDIYVEFKNDLMLKYLEDCELSE